jgi:hypothetical protein
MLSGKGKILKRKKKSALEQEEKKEDEHKSNNDNLGIENDNYQMENNDIPESNQVYYQNNNMYNSNEIQNFNNNQYNSDGYGNDVPEFLLRPENDHYFQSYIRLRQRNITDGAILLNLEQDDIANNRVDLYDNKSINLIKPILSDKNPLNEDYFIESTNRDKFIKIPKQQVMKLQRLEKIEEGKRKIQNIINKEDIKKPVIDINADFLKITEEENFEKFDKKLTDVINKTANKISLLFLFIQGLLAGKRIYF